MRDRTGVFVERHWKPLNRPVINGRSGDVEFLLHTVTDETERVLRERGLIEDALQALELGAGHQTIDEAFLADSMQIPAEPESAPPLADLDDLTAREKEVVALAIQGKPSKVIAMKLGISVRTVEVFRAQILKKTQVNSFFELARSIWKRGPNHTPHIQRIDAALRYVLTGRRQIEKAYDLIERIHIVGQNVERAERTLRRLKAAQLEHERDLKKLIYDVASK